MREENIWCKKPRYSEVRVIARRVIARYERIYFSDYSGALHPSDVTTVKLLYANAGSLTVG